MCKICWNSVQEFHVFLERIEEAQKKWKPKGHCGIDANVKNEGINLEATEILYPITKSEIKEEKEERMHEDDSPRNLAESCIDVVKDSCSSTSSSEEYIVAKPKRKRIRKKKSDPIKVKENKEKMDKEDQEIRDFYAMICEFCTSEVFGNITEAREHYRLKHKQIGYLKCCDRKFFNRPRLMDHIALHKNPDAFK